MKKKSMGNGRGEKYLPKPIDTSGTRLPRYIHTLREKLAENFHDVWTSQRLQDGWTYGKSRNDRAKRHPNLVPYGALPESEKAYDRTVTEQTLKSIYALGYTVEPPKGSHRIEDQPLREIARMLADKAAPDLIPLVRLWQNRDPLARYNDPSLYSHLAARLIVLEEAVIAYDVVSQGLSTWPDNPNLLHKMGLILARMGLAEDALRVAARLEKMVPARDPLRDEVLGLLGRCHKELWEKETNLARRRAYLDGAFAYYSRAYKGVRGTYYTGINAAHTALLKGATHEACALAARVARECESEQRSRGNSYWLLATLGHAYLIQATCDLHFMDNAERWLCAAARVGTGNHGELNATKKSLRQIRENVQLPAAFESHLEALLSLYSSPCVVVFSGHMEDRPGRRTPRFPHRIVPYIKRAIAERLREISACVGYASAACGADLLFHEVMQEIGGETHVVLPFGQAQFLTESVAIGEHAAYWRRKFNAVIKSASSVVTVSQQNSDFGSVYYEYANLVLNGLSRIRAAQLDTSLKALAVWNGQRGDGPGGTASMYRHWKNVMKISSVAVINPIEFITDGDTRVPNIGGPGGGETTGAPIIATPSIVASPAYESIKAILFADVVKFSSLGAGQIQNFVRHFLGSIARLLEDTPNKPETRNTWGDGLYFVFDTVEHAGHFALDLCELVSGVSWGEKGLNDAMSIRIALHAGPVFCSDDPILKTKNYTGYHVNMTARLEPITPPGQVYATQQFACIASFQNVAGFTCDFVGQLPFPKGFGLYPIYHLRRKLLV